MPRAWKDSDWQLAQLFRFTFDQRAAAAWRAISLRRLLLSFAARAGPPAKPP
jgi:hypothetical protein